MNKVKRVLIVLGLIAALTSASYLLGWSSFFSVKEIIVTGAPNDASAQSVLAATEITRGEKLARIETRVATKALSNIAWIDHSHVARDWIHQRVTIQVSARTPIARYGEVLVDKNGAVFSLPNYQAGTLPLVKSANPDSLNFAVRLLTQLPQSVTSVLQEIQTQGTHSAVFSLSINGRVLNITWGDESDMALKVKVYQALIALPENSKITDMDVSAPHAPIVK